MATTTHLFRWGKYYGVGLEEIDREHEQVANLLNELYAAWLDGAPRTELSKRLQSLIDAVAGHFENEEKIMADGGYPGLGGHQAEHAFLANHVGEFQREFNSGNAELSESTMTYLKDWLRDHILISDKRMGEYLLTH
jgi:hemerythrin-like metal-binding protein